MESIEKKIVQNVAWVLSIGIGLFVANKLYNVGTTGYIKIFHSDEYDEAIKKLKEEEA